MISHIIFDYDGTLVDSLSIYLQGFQTVFAEFGITVNQFEIAENCFGTIDGAKNLGIKDTKLFYNRVDDLIKPQISKPPLFNNVKDTLDELLVKGIKMSIVSSSSKKDMNSDLKNKGLLKYFDLIISGDDTKNLKPDPEGILKVIDYYNQPKSNFLMVGDSKKDIQAAFNAGIKSCLFFPKKSEIYYIYKDLIKNYKPDFVLKDFFDLSQIIDSSTK